MKVYTAPPKAAFDQCLKTLIQLNVLNEMCLQDGGKDNFGAVIFIDLVVILPLILTRLPTFRTIIIQHLLKNENVCLNKITIVMLLSYSFVV